MKRILTLAIALLSCAVVFAQNITNTRFKNSVSISSAFIGVPHEIMTSDRLNDQYTFSYARSIYKNIGLEVAYAYWNKRNQPGGSNDYYVMVPSPANPAAVRGSLYERHAYQYLDMLAFKDCAITAHQWLHLAAGYSHCQGYNRYIQDYVGPDEYSCYEMIVCNRRPVNYDGLVCKAAYDFDLVKGRIRLGAEATYRQYFISFCQYEVGAHMGVCF